MSGHAERNSDDARWTALIKRDRSFDGAFVYAVTSTGIYCRPGCSARQPARHNVRFFDTTSAAEEAGFRACRRCRPGGLSPKDRENRLIQRACQQLEEEEPPGLRELAAEAGLSLWHFQRLFKASVGITPKQYAVMQRRRRFASALEGRTSVTNAVYDAGFGAPSRAFEDARNWFQMNPSTFRAGAKGLGIRSGIGRSSLGWIVVAATDKGVCSIEFIDRAEDALRRLTERFPGAQIEKGDKTFSSLVQKVVDLIEADGPSIDLPLDIRGTAFQQRVWKALIDIPRGTTLSYSELASRIGKPKAVRAVAGACAANPLAVQIPCHRVVRTDGGMGGYRWGIQRKTALIEREKAGSLLRQSIID